jgi:hypothetical protein
MTDLVPALDLNTRPPELGVLTIRPQHYALLNCVARLGDKRAGFIQAIKHDKIHNFCSSVRRGLKI